MQNIQNQKKKKVTRKNILSAPETQGVYLFWDNSVDKPLYIGKAINLKRRLISYLSPDVNLKTSQLMKESVFFSVIKVNSELEALLLEANLIKHFQPKFNIELKDDKHPLYIKITKDVFPQVLTARKIDVKEKTLAFFGPYPSSTNVKMVLKLLRRLFPYSQHPPAKRPCLYSQIGLCNPCPSGILNEKDENKKSKMHKIYRGNIKNIKRVLEGKINSVRNDLEKEMGNLAKEQQFEEAQLIKKKIESLDYITQPVTPTNYFLQNPYFYNEVRENETTELKKIVNNYSQIQLISLERIECYDIAHLAGEKPTASMVTFIKGEPDKQLYRHFKIHQKKGYDDIASMAEVAERRTKYLPLWGIPDLIIVDGGKVQTKVFSEIFFPHDIAVAGLAKRYETLVFMQKDGSFKEVRLNRGDVKNLVQRIRNEAHRFARRLHHKLITKEFLVK